MSDDGGNSYNLREYFSHVSPKLGANTARMYSLEQLRDRRRGLLVRRGIHEALRAPQPHLRRLPQGAFRPRFLCFCIHSAHTDATVCDCSVGAMRQCTTSLYLCLRTRTRSTSLTRSDTITTHKSTAGAARVPLVGRGEMRLRHETQLWFVLDIFQVLINVWLSASLHPLWCTVWLGCTRVA